MKKMIRTLMLALSLLVSTQAFAQYVPAWEKGDLQKSGSGIAVKGQTLDRAATLALLKAAGGAQLADEWAGAISKRGLGIGLTAGGFGVGALGAGLALAGGMGGAIFGGLFGAMSGDASKGAEEGSRNPLTTAGLIAAGAGIAAGIVGIVQISSANSTMDGIVDRCNMQGPAAHSTSLTVGATPSGVGLAFRF